MVDILLASSRHKTFPEVIFFTVVFWWFLLEQMRDVKAACPPLDCDRFPVNPTCASDGMLYENECDIKQKNCRAGGNGVVPMPWSYCKASRCRHTACARNLRLTCGDDGQIHSNACMLVWASCGKNRPIVEISMDVCLRIKCPSNCLPDDPICHSEVKQCRDQWTYR